ncbi:MAG: hypothetical protein IPL59_12530 [Candidatus Competibacteraceae bacterium]|nr:hypothetical protein [Candidatus Competibacteraceae bacterium]
MVHSGKAVVEKAAASMEKQADRATPWLWVFVSTLGELNAIEPFLRQLSEVDFTGLAFLTDHAHYRSNYLQNFPLRKSK